jgi:hypothetical protein
MGRGAVENPKLRQLTAGGSGKAGPYMGSAGYSGGTRARWVPDKKVADF